MHICILNEFFYPDNTGGTGSVLSDLVSSMRKKECNTSIDVITSRFCYRYNEELLNSYEEWNDIRIFRVDSPKSHKKKTLSRLLINFIFSYLVLMKLLYLNKQKKYDVILVSTAPPVLVGIANIFKMITRIPYIYILYDLDPDRAIVMKVLSPNGLGAKILMFVQNYWLHKSSKVIVLGRCMKDYISQKYKVLIENIEVISVGYNPEDMPLIDKHDAKFRIYNKLNGFLLCYSGNFGRYHDFDTIINAAKKISLINREIQFVLVGDGAQRDHIEKRIHDEKIDNVHLFNFLPLVDYPDLLASADASLVTLEPGMEGLCVPSKFYGILSSARPTVGLMSPVCEVARVIQETECGIRIDVHDVEGLVKAILSLANDPIRATEMGLRARQVLEMKYSTDLVAASYLSTLSQVIEKSVKSGGA